MSATVVDKQYHVKFNNSSEKIQSWAYSSGKITLLDHPVVEKLK